MNVELILARKQATIYNVDLWALTLRRALSSLTEWGLLDASQDFSAHYASAEEFERRNLQWSLTRKGEATMAGVLCSLEVLQHSAIGLQTAVLNAIGDALADIPVLLDTAEDIKKTRAPAYPPV